ncbi:MAG: radical SAM protein [Clostridiales bacterium]|jgi:nitrogen fixation protein NifB|nr:radical SAM protein [Clostridiales bacterium]
MEQTAHVRMDVKSLDEKFAHLAKNHPCLGRAPHKGRLHLPVSPACNIKCRFCTRAFNAIEERPGVTRRVLTVAEAPEAIDRALRLCPEISVVGVAGPGDSLATGHALACFRAMHEKYPDLLACLSTNGLLLPDHVEEILRAGVRTVTVTVNAVDPEIGARIVEKVSYKGKLYTGTEGAEILIDNQLRGIRLLAERDVLVKINTVLIPEINGGHIGAIAAATAERGAAIINIIPLIPQGDFLEMEPPTCAEINTAREAAEAVLPVFRHCQHCRADACGRLGGQDVSDQLFENLSAENTFSHG